MSILSRCDNCGRYGAYHADSCVQNLKTKTVTRIIAELRGTIGTLESDNERYRTTIAQLEEQLQFSPAFVSTLTTLGFPDRFLEEYRTQKMDIRKYQATIVQLQKERAEAVERVRVLEAEVRAAERYRGERGSF